MVAPRNGITDTGYVLHARPWQETSRLLEVLTASHGRLGLVARGAQRPSSRLRGVLQPFRPLHLSWSGRGALHTLCAAEPAGHPTAPSGTVVMAAFYLNELLLAFLRRSDAHPGLYAAYEAAIVALGAGSAADTEPVLRRFEIRLLAEIGYGLSLGHDATTGQRLDPAARYEYIVEQGAVPAVAGDRPLVFNGAELDAIDRMAFADPAVLRAAKRLLRAVLAHHLGGRSLRTREVMAAMRR